MNNYMDIDALMTLMAPAEQTRQVMQVPGHRIDGAAPGCYAMEITDDVYHGQCTGASSSALKKLLRSPAHYRAYQSAPDRDSSARMFGRAVHTLLLERHLYREHFAVWNGGRRDGKKYEEFEAANPGRTILTEDEHHRAMEAALSLRSNTQFPMGLWLDGVAASGEFDAIAPARTEFSIFWIDEETGLSCKARIDAHNLSPTPMAADVKTTDDARPSAFSHQVFKLDYDLQAAHYRAALKAFYDQEFPFLFAVVESKAPHASTILGMDQDVLKNGEAKRRFALNLLKKCQDANSWPAYELEGIPEIYLPFYGRFSGSAES